MGVKCTLNCGFDNPTTSTRTLENEPCGGKGCKGTYSVNLTQMAKNRQNRQKQVNLVWPEGSSGGPKKEAKTDKAK